MLGTTAKLNDSNYLSWTQAFCLFIGAQNKLAYLLHAPLVYTDPTYVIWLTGDYFVMTWLLNSLEEKISSSVMFLTTAKQMWRCPNSYIIKTFPMSTWCWTICSTQISTIDKKSSLCRGSTLCMKYKLQRHAHRCQILESLTSFTRAYCAFLCH